MNAVLNVALNIGVGAFLTAMGMALLMVVASWLDAPTRYSRAIFYSSMAVSAVAVATLLAIQPLRIGSGSTNHSVPKPDAELGPQRR